MLPRWDQQHSENRPTWNHLVAVKQDLRCRRGFSWLNSVQQRLWAWSHQVSKQLTLTTTGLLKVQLSKDKLLKYTAQIVLEWCRVRGGRLISASCHGPFKICDCILNLPRIKKKKIGDFIQLMGNKCIPTFVLWDLVPFGKSLEDTEESWLEIGPC